MKIRYSEFVTIIGLLITSFSLLHLLGPNGVDWQAYSSTTVDFSKFYFYREPVGWGFVWLFRDMGPFVLSGIILSFLSISSYMFARAICHSNLVPFLLAIVLIGSNLFLLPAVNGLRQGLALGFIFLFLWSYINRNNGALFFFYIFSVLCHNSALIFGLFIVFFYIRSGAVRVLLLLAYVLASSYIIQIAGKNSNPTVTNNSLLFFAASSVVLAFTLFPRINAHNKDMCHLSILVFILSGAFLWASAVYERLIYYSLPVAICVSSYRLVDLKPALIRNLLIVLLALVSWSYALQNQSVKKNFLYASEGLK